MKLFKRSVRAFDVTIGDPWTINGKPTDGADPRSVLEEIYDAAVYFPITITVVGPEVSYVLEMDEEMNTRHMDSVSEPEARASLASTPTLPAAPTSGAIPVETGTEASSEYVAEPIEEITEVENLLTEANDDAAEAIEPIDENEELSWSPEGAPATSSELVLHPNPDQDKKNPLTSPFGKNTFILGGAALVVMAVLVVVGAQFINFGSSSNDAAASNAEAPAEWQTPFPESESAGQSLDADFTSQLWSLEPGEFDSVSWFAAGVVITDGDDVRLHSHLTGNEESGHTVGEELDLSEDLQWAAEFIHDGSPAVGLRIADTFVALTSDGEEQAWEVPEGFEIHVYGSTPMMTNVADQDDEETIFYALQVGEEDPVELTINPDMATRAVDADWIIQLTGNAPRVALNPVDRSNEDTTAHAVDLTVPAEEATFIRHLDAGHGTSMALWSVDSDLFIGIHPLEGSNPGEAATFVPAPFTEDEAVGWSIARGMDLTIIGPYAIELSTGELVAYSDNGDFSEGYGPAAVRTDETDRRQFSVDHTEYTETDRIIGYTGRGTILVRLTDGSVAAYGEDGGTA